MPEVVLGPILRHVGETNATVWVETDAACEVEVLGAKQETFCVCGHHYALVCVEGLDPRARTEYDVKLDDEVGWPPPDSGFPSPLINTLDPDRPLRMLFGSCRVALPHEPPYSLEKDEDDRGRGHDALYILAKEMLATRDEDEGHKWPDLLLLLGDQVYADEVSPETLDYIRRTRGTDDPPGEEIANYEEYTRLYRESWSQPTLRWLLSTVPSAMVIDDHDMHDDWNISRSWVEDMRERDWWEERLLGGLASYWVYQHLGNLSPERLAESDLYRRVREADDGYEELRQFAAEDDRRHEGVRWSYTRELGATKLIVLDDRTGRVLDEGRREIIDPETWEWVVGETEDEFEHLVIGVSDPAIMTRGLSYAENWGEAICEGRWGSVAAKLGEKLRRGVDFDHWPAFRRSFYRLAELLRDVGSRESGTGFDHPAVRRRPPCIPRGGGIPAGVGCRQHRPPGGLLAVSKPAGPWRAPGDPAEPDARGRGGGPQARPRGRRPGPTVRMALRRGPVLRQPGRHAGPRRRDGDGGPRQDRGRRNPPRRCPLGAGLRA